MNELKAGDLVLRMDDSLYAGARWVITRCMANDIYEIHLLNGRKVRKVKGNNLMIDVTKQN